MPFYDRLTVNFIVLTKNKVCTRKCNEKEEVSFHKYFFKYLKKKGIDESRMTYKGYSRNKPIIEDDRQEANARVNRRVEITVLKK